MALGFFDANCGGSAAAEAFEAQCAGTGKQFEDSRVVDAAAEAVEDGLFDEVRSWTDVEAFWNFQDSPRLFAAGNTHGRSIRRFGCRGNKKPKIRMSKSETNPKFEIRIAENAAEFTAMRGSFLWNSFDFGVSLRHFLRLG